MVYSLTMGGKSKQKVRLHTKKKPKPFLPALPCPALYNPSVLLSPCLLGIHKPETHQEQARPRTYVCKTIVLPIKVESIAWHPGRCYNISHRTPPGPRNLWQDDVWKKSLGNQARFRGKHQSSSRFNQKRIKYHHGWTSQKEQED